MLRSKLSNKYQRAAPGKWVKGDTVGLDPVLLSRIAYVGQINNTVIAITDGYRSYADQVKMYALYLAGKLQATAANPGTSRHGFRLAADISTQPLRGMTNAQLRPYGLHKPITAEGWHVEPIETAGKTLAQIKALAPEEVEEDMTDAEVKKLIEESKTVYKTASDIPDWGKAVIQKLISRGSIIPNNGAINITHEMLRILEIMDREDD